MNTGTREPALIAAQFHADLLAESILSNWAYVAVAYRGLHCLHLLVVLADCQSEIPGLARQ